MKTWSTARAEELIAEASRLGAPQRLLVLAACTCARAVLHLTRLEDRAVCETAIETAERWTCGEATREECDRAAGAAWRAAGAAEATRAFASLWGVKRAADAAWIAVIAPARAARAAGAADAAGAVGAAMAAWAAQRTDEGLQALRNAVRSVLTAEVMRDLAYNRAVRELEKRVLGNRPSKRRKAAWDEALASGALRAVLTAWSEVDESDREDKQESLARLEQGLKDFFCH